MHTHTHIFRTEKCQKSRKKASRVWGPQEGGPGATCDVPRVCEPEEKGPRVRGQVGGQPLGQVIQVYLPVGIVDRRHPCLALRPGYLESPEMGQEKNRPEIKTALPTLFDMNQE